MPTDKIRCGAPRYDPGGGEINMARAAHTLGASAVAMFPAGGTRVRSCLVLRSIIGWRSRPISTKWSRAGA
jgi:6-phosphofructokinase 2